MKFLITGPRCCTQREQTEDGFTLIEVMAAVLIIMVAAVALAAVLTQSLAALSLSRQTQQASNLAASIVAEVEALPWSTVSNGLSSSASSDSHFSTDGNIGGTASSYCFEGMPLLVGGVAAATCPTSGTGSSSQPWSNISASSCNTSLAATLSSSTAPLIPHEGCVTLNSTQFEISAYPTLYSGTSVSSTGAQVEVTVVVTWGGGTSDSTKRTRVTDTVILANCSASAVRCS
jgi:Tfp pilus assembly protein PilV